MGKLFLKICFRISDRMFIRAKISYAEERQQNNYPIILVNGFAGWGREEMLGVKYWGGVHDIQEDLKRNGYTVHTAPVGPVSSNWDRACELHKLAVGQ